MVTTVSADRTVDNVGKQIYYLAYVKINDNQLHLLKNIKLYQGMPVQVMIMTQKRTFWDYIVTPIIESLNRAFREE